MMPPLDPALLSPNSRKRPAYAALILLTILIGLASRRFSFLLPGWLAKNAGDMLYAVMAFWLAGFLFPRLSTLRTALAAGLFCVGIEFLKLVQAPWLAAARHSPAGALVFGSGFHVSNLVCYGIGVAVAALAEGISSAGLPPRAGGAAGRS